MKGSSPDFRGQRREDCLQARVWLVRKREGARWLAEDWHGQGSQPASCGKAKNQLAQRGCFRVSGGRAADQAGGCRGRGRLESEAGGSVNCAGFSELGPELWDEVCSLEMFLACEKQPEANRTGVTSPVHLLPFTWSCAVFLIRTYLMLAFISSRYLC